VNGDKEKRNGWERIKGNKNRDGKKNREREITTERRGERKMARYKCDQKCKELTPG